MRHSAAEAAVADMLKWFALRTVSSPFSTVLGEIYA